MLTELIEDALRPYLPAPPPASPVVEVASCRNCPAARDVGWGIGPASGAHVRCCFAGPLALRADGTSPDGCPLRSGPVTIRLVDRGRP
jgi:hypothetical protein